MRRTKRLETVAHHEAGHAVAAAQHRVRLHSLSIVPDVNSAGKFVHHSYFGGIHPEWDDSPRVQRRIENMALVCCAGPAAQRRFNPKDIRHDHAVDDRHQAIGYLSLLESDNEILSVYINLIELRARQYVAGQFVWHHIKMLAQALLDRQHLTGKEIHAAIEASNKEINDEIVSRLPASLKAEPEAE